MEEERAYNNVNLQLLQTISIRSMNIERSILRPTAPGIA